MSKFYNHFERDKPTNIGKWMAYKMSDSLVDMAGTINSVLEIGPGRGVIADICRGRGIKYTAIEPNDLMANEIEIKGHKVYRKLVPPLPEDLEKVDCVILKNVLEHMPTMNEALQLCTEIKGTLNPDGIILISVPDYFNEKHLFYSCDFSHNYVTTKKRVVNLLESCGYINIKSEYHSFIFKGLMCFIISFIAARLPFIWFDSIFDNIVIHKLSKLQLSLLRIVFISGDL